VAILKEGHNCWRRAHADRAGFLIDGKAYFEALAGAVEKAQETICIAAWDIDSRIKLLRDGNGAGTGELGDFLNDKAQRIPEMRIYVLSWDFPMLYLREREPLPIFNLGWKTHRRIHFHLDDEHPIGASQHQKLVLIDNRVAFCGGLDLTNHRWDTPAHRSDDPRRIDPDGEPYGPFHDVQMIVDGEAAAALGELFVDRWRLATGDWPDLAGSASEAPWPEDLAPGLEDIDVAVARTLPAYKGREAVCEVETLYRDAVAAAETCVYIENQYLTSQKVVRSLADSLSQAAGPEVVIVLPQKSSGWLEQSTMDALRARHLKALADADRHDRLRVYYPALGDGGTSVYVHSKLMVVDDRLAIVGSANLSNRSMGFDSECNLAIEAEPGTEAAGAVAALRHRLLAEHLGTSAETVSDAFSGRDSLIGAIDALTDTAGRHLKKLPVEPAGPIDAAELVGDEALLDPEAPVEFDRLMDRFVQNDGGRAKMRQVVKITVVLLVLVSMAAAWRWTPLSEWIDRENLAAWAGALKGSPLSYPAVVGVFVAGGLLMVPVTLMIGVTAMVFDPPFAAFYALSGCLSNALASYLIGAALGRQAVRRLAGRRLNRLSRQMAERGIWAMAIIRNIPVAPFSIVNMIAGASHIRLRDFLIGTGLGMLPGILAITLFADRLLQSFKNPNWINALVVAGLALVLILGSWWAKKRLSAGRRKD
jgi:phosphatidylserine/phosphatidylglycerophosphate/cardiolipin synthase-like enzyme/uncharacterized membrane protein YdjX (TVP38/TMEM64 family)